MKQVFDHLSAGQSDGVVHRREIQSRGEIGKSEGLFSQQYKNRFIKEGTTRRVFKGENERASMGSTLELTRAPSLLRGILFKKVQGHYFCCEYLWKRKQRTVLFGISSSHVMNFTSDVSLKPIPNPIPKKRISLWMKNNPNSPQKRQRQTSISIDPGVNAHCSPFKILK